MDAGYSSLEIDLAGICKCDRHGKVPSKLEVLPIGFQAHLHEDLLGLFAQAGRDDARAALR